MLLLMQLFRTENVQETLRGRDSAGRGRRYPGGGETN